VAAKDALRAQVCPRRAIQEDNPQKRIKSFRIACRCGNPVGLNCAWHAACPRYMEISDWSSNEGELIMHVVVSASAPINCLYHD
jgi:hypothetical protein